MSQQRAPLIGALLGLVLLVAVAGFAIGLPKVQGAESDDVAGVLPDTLPAVEGLPDGVSADDTLDGSEEETTFAEQTSETQDDVAANLAEAYDADVAVRAYSDAQTGLQMAVVVVADPGSVSIPDRLPVDAERLGVDQAPVEMSRDGDVVCTSFFATAPPTDPSADPATAPAAEPTGVSCQLADEERTYAVQGSGLDAGQASDLLRELAA